MYILREDNAGRLKRRAKGKSNERNSRNEPDRQAEGIWVPRGQVNDIRIN